MASQEVKKFYKLVEGVLSLASSWLLHAVYL